MDKTTTITITEARKRLFQIAKEVQIPGRSYTLTEKGRPKVTIISFEEYDSLKETIEVLTEFPNLKKDMEEAEKAVKTGEYKNWTTLEDLLGREGFVFHDKSSNKYEVSSSAKTKSRKTTRKITKS